MSAPMPRGRRYIFLVLIFSAIFALLGLNLTLQGNILDIYLVHWTHHGARFLISNIRMAAWIFGGFLFISWWRPVNIEILAILATTPLYSYAVKYAIAGTVGGAMGFSIMTFAMLGLLAVSVALLIETKIKHKFIRYLGWIPLIYIAISLLTSPQVTEIAPGLYFYADKIGHIIGYVYGSCIGVVGAAARDLLKQRQNKVKERFR